MELHLREQLKTFAFSIIKIMKQMITKIIIIIIIIIISLKMQMNETFFNRESILKFVITCYFYEVCFSFCSYAFVTWISQEPDNYLGQYYQ